MPNATRRTVLAGVTATVAAPSLPASPAPIPEATTRVPLAESAVIMAEDGVLTFLGMSQQAAERAFSSHFRWQLHRMARRAGSVELVAQTEWEAQEASATLAAMLRAERFEEAEIAAYLEHQRNGADEAELPS